MLHEIPIRAYGVAAVVVRKGSDEARFLLLQRTRRPISAWTYVAGAIEAGEKAYHAAVREVREESGLSVSTLYSADLYEQFYEIDKNSIWIAPVFVAFVDEESDVILNTEHSAYRWCTAEGAITLLTFPGAREIVEKVNRNFVEETPNPFLRIKDFRNKEI
jgi:dihydroneopterin triphosphate diphosphatase